MIHSEKSLASTEADQFSSFMPTKESKAEFDKLLSRYSPEIRALANKMRLLVLKSLPVANEKTFFGWSNTWYGTSEKAMESVFSVSPLKSYVQLYFLKGSELSDPDGLLEGTGKKLRHVNVRSAEALKRPSLLRLMKQAVAHNKKGKPNAQSKSRNAKRTK